MGMNGENIEYGRIFPAFDIRDSTFIIRH